MKIVKEKVDGKGITETKGKINMINLLLSTRIIVRKIKQPFSNFPNRWVDYKRYWSKWKNKLECLDTLLPVGERKWNRWGWAETCF